MREGGVLRIVRGMKINFLIVVLLASIAFTGARATAADVEPGFVSLFDGKSFNGWKKPEEHPDTWKIEDGALVAHGDRCHLFYVEVVRPTIRTSQSSCGKETGAHATVG